MSIKNILRTFNGIKDEIETTNGGKKGKYGKDLTKIKFDTDDNLPLNKQLKLRMLELNNF